jgi:2-keto-3-deoxy-L-rhamnonate aldolase RhmA
LDEVDTIAAVEGIDSLFIGRGDLTAAIADESPEPPAVRQAVERIAAAARQSGKAVSVFVMGRKDADWLKSLGASAFILSSDQGFLRQAAMRGLAELRDSAE